MNKTENENLQPRKSKRGRRNKGMCLEDRPVLEPNAAGIDVGAREMFVAVPPGRDDTPVPASFRPRLAASVISTVALRYHFTSITL
jgi:hypothetical protein